MVVPSKHIRFSESLLGLGGMVLLLLNIQHLTIDEIWKKYARYNNKAKFPAYHSFDNLLLSVDMLFAIGAIDITEEGKIYNATN